MGCRHEVRSPCKANHRHGVRPNKVGVERDGKTVLGSKITLNGHRPLARFKTEVW